MTVTFIELCAAKAAVKKPRALTWISRVAHCCHLTPKGAVRGRCLLRSPPLQTLGTTGSARLLEALTRLAYGDPVYQDVERTKERDLT